jgi:drug/metabolite transporter (DMT)-like permease
LYVLRYIPLSIAFPISQAVHVLVPLGSWFVLGENIVTMRWIGIALVSLGLAVVARPVARLEEEL